MNALDAVTAHDVVNELGTLVSRERLSHGTRFPRAASQKWLAKRAEGPALWKRLLLAVKRAADERALAAMVSRTSPHLLRDIGIDPANVPYSVSHKVDRMMADEERRAQVSKLAA